VKIGTLGPPNAGHDHLDAVRQRQLREARKAGWPELQREDLVDRRFGIVEHRPSGRLYKLHQGDLLDANVYLSVAAWFVAGSGAIRFLEDPPGGSPRTVAELEERRGRR
jgi:hypothetical protein